MRLRMIKPQVDKIDLGDGEWIEVRRELTAGEQRKALARSMTVVGMGMSPNLEQLGKAEVLAYLLDWSIADESGKRIEVSEDALDNLHPEAYKLIADAIEAHVRRVDEEAKKATTANTLSEASASAE